MLFCKHTNTGRRTSDIRNLSRQLLLLMTWTKASLSVKNVRQLGKILTQQYSKTSKTRAKVHKTISLGKQLHSQMNQKHRCRAGDGLVIQLRVKKKDEPLKFDKKANHVRISDLTD